MTGDKLIYKYVSNDIPLRKVNQSYSNYHGEEFIKSWLKSREKAKKYFTKKLNFKLTNKPSSPTQAKFNRWIKEINNREFNDAKEFNLLLKRFEVTKKIFDNYDSSFRPINREKYNDIRLYALFSWLLVLNFKYDLKLQYLNSLLKVNDITLCHLDSLPLNYKKLVAFSVKKEKDYIVFLRKKINER